jgi:hypothetical protein
MKPSLEKRYKLHKMLININYPNSLKAHFKLSEKAKGRNADCEDYGRRFKWNPDVTSHMND